MHSYCRLRQILLACKFLSHSCILFLLLIWGYQKTAWHSRALLSFDVRNCGSNALLQRRDSCHGSSAQGVHLLATGQTLLLCGLFWAFAASKNPDFSGFGWLAAVYLGVTAAVTFGTPGLDTVGIVVRAAT